MLHLLEIPDLPPLAFRKAFGKKSPQTLEGGKGDAPPPPDYAGAAQATAQGNLQMAREAVEANRVNQFTPYGSSTWTRPAESGKGVWEQYTQLTPEAQRALDAQLSLNTKYGETANIGFDRARQLFENPQLDTSVLPERAINVGQTAQEAILSRLNPQLQLQDEQLRARLANQGIGLGSTAYQREMAMQGQRANDLQMQAALQGITFDQANRGAALQEQAYLQDRPLNLINALRTGNQVQAPQFQQFAQQQAVGGPNMLGAAQAQYGAHLDAYNAQQAQNGGLAGGLFSIGGAALGGLMGGGIQGAQLGAGLGGAFGRALF